VTRDAPPVAELVPGVLVRHVPAGPFEDLDKSDLPAQLCHFTFEVLRTEAAYAPGRKTDRSTPGLTVQILAGSAP
jgi:D-inositol-3-phosphate glycosyltransferase